MKDEMDVLRHTSDKASKYEMAIETYKKKLEDLGDLKRQVKLLEDKNTMYMQNTVELEEVINHGQGTISSNTFALQNITLNGDLSSK